MTDRELDALIAERVMGWTKVYDTDDHKNDWLDPAFPGWRGNLSDGWREGALIPEPFLSTTGDGMLAVVEAMRNREDGFDCKILLKDYAHVLFDNGDDDTEWTLADGPHWAMDASLPRAVCLAALKALGVDVH